MNLLLTRSAHFWLPCRIIAGNAVHDFTGLFELGLCERVITSGFEFGGLVVEYEAAAVIVRHLTAGINGLGMQHRCGQDKRRQKSEDGKKAVHELYFLGRGREFTALRHPCKWPWQPLSGPPLPQYSHPAVHRLARRVLQRPAVLVAPIADDFHSERLQRL